MIDEGFTRLAPEFNRVSKPKRQKYFEQQRKDWSDREIRMEMLYAQQILIEKTDKVRGNTNTMIWFLIVIPIILAFLAFIISISSL